MVSTTIYKVIKQTENSIKGRSLLLYKSKGYYIGKFISNCNEMFRKLQLQARTRLLKKTIEHGTRHW